MDPIESVQPDHTHDEPGSVTVVHHFLMAVPGFLRPVNVISNAAKPRTLKEFSDVTVFAANSLQCPPDSLVYQGCTVLEDEPYVEPEQPKGAVVPLGRRLITPPKGLIVPGRD